VVTALAEHIATHLAALDRLEQHGYRFNERRVRILSTDARAAVADRVEAAAGVAVVRQPLDHKYYDGVRFMIDVRTRDGVDVPFIDGGMFDWVGKLAANRRFVFVASGMGSQLAAFLFRD
jgi:hypothetical protein